MEIAFIGLGKLGFPCAVALAMRGHRVRGYDRNAEIMAAYERGEVTPFEPGLDEQYAGARSRMSFERSILDAVRASEAIFVAVPTPHAPTHDGSLPYDGLPRDFDNGPIRDCLSEIGAAIRAIDDDVFRTIFIVSTVTPTTMVGELIPAMVESAGEEPGLRWGVVYNPFFIGQSTVVRDFLSPEFVLAGHSPSPIVRTRTERATQELYGSLHDRPIRSMTWTEAECVKLSYNTYLGLKVLFANTVMEMCHALPDCDCDTVNGALKLATDRLVSPKYMDGGMADGGPCHGRDQMAMSFAARKAGIGFDIFDVINKGRDHQTAYLAELVRSKAAGRPVVLLGMAFKPGTNQTQGSPAMLLANILRDRGVEPLLHDPVIRPDTPMPDVPALYFISTRWDSYADHLFRAGDTVIDPWRMLRGKQLADGVEYVPVGIGPASNSALGSSQTRNAAQESEACEPKLSRFTGSYTAAIS